MRQGWLGGPVIVVGIMASTAGITATISEEELRANLCTANDQSFQSPAQVLLAALQGTSPQIAQQQWASCPPPPTDYQTPPNVTAAGDVTVKLMLGSGAGVGTDNRNLCSAGKIVQQHRSSASSAATQLTISLTNTLRNTGPDRTKNCPIEGYLNGAPVPAQCSQPEQRFKAAPGKDGRFYPIETSVPHLADGSTNLHTHGLEVSPKPCHDEVLRSTLYAANWGGSTAPLLACQDAPIS